MSLSRTTRMTVTMSALVIFAAAAILYFDGLLKPTNDTAQMNGIQSNAGMSNENAAPAALAQFRAECTLKDGKTYRGIVSVPSLQSPSDLKAVELKTEGGDMIRFAQNEAQCQYAPY